MKKNYLFLLFTFLCTPIFAHQVIELSGKPWKFKKIESDVWNVSSEVKCVEDVDCSSLFDGSLSTLWKSGEKSKTLTIDLGEPRSIASIKIIFGNEDTEKINYKLFTARESIHSWNTLVDYSTVSQQCLFKMTSEMGALGSTVGHIEKKEYAYIEPSLSDYCRYIKLEIHGVRDRDNENIDIEFREIEIYAQAVDKENDKNIVLNTGGYINDWETVGIPHCYNDKDSYLNVSSMVPVWKGEAWYIHHFNIDSKEKGKRFYLEFKCVSVAAGVYINGKFKQGNTQVPQPGEVTHVGAFIPFVVDITEDVMVGKENMLAVKISNSANSFFTWPGFAVFESFGMGWGGIFSKVNLHVTHDIHIPLNNYSGSGEWGTYNAIKSADETIANLFFQTNIKNTHAVSKKVKLTTQLLDVDGKIVNSVQQDIQLEAQSIQLIEQDLEIENPILWYPNNSEYGEPYLYKVVRIVSDGKKELDRFEENLGIRTITWDTDYCYINGKKHILQGFGHRNIYPALGSAVPEELQWKDISYIAQCGGNTLRMGHLPPFPEMLEACDVYGIMVMLNSGDTEWSLKNEPAISYKREYDRNAILAFRNHPSVIMWESNNGLAKDGELYLPSYTQEIVDKLDFVNPRIVMNRDGFPPEWDRNRNIVIGYTNWYWKESGFPSINTEVYGANWEGRASWNIARFDYENEKRFTSWYVNNYLADLENKACGWIDWMLAETQGEGYTIYLNGKRNQKSLGSSAMDANRFPKLKYKVYEKALWVPFEKKPGVALQTTWDLSDVQNIDVWSNCPYVEVFVNDRSYGVRDNNRPDKRCTWENIVWEKGMVRAYGLDENREVCCADTIFSSEEPYRIELILEPVFTKPDGTSFDRKANGSDVVLVTARILDKNGNLCTLSDNNIVFEVDGEGRYCGSSNFYVTEGKPLEYHAPGDKELQAEGGLMRIAVKSTFTSGNVFVKAYSHGLESGECSFTFN